MSKAFIGVDLQVTFCEGGNLAVPGGNDAAEAVYQHLSHHWTEYDLIVFTRDWHIDPGGHFAAPGEEPDWADSFPVHGVAGTPDAEFHPRVDDVIRFLKTDAPARVISKGQFAASFSGFDGTDELGVPLATLLRSYGVDSLDVGGIATEFCVKATAIDGVHNGFAVRVLPNLVAGLGADAIQEAYRVMTDAGIEVGG